MSQPPDPFEFLKSLWAPMGLPMILAPTLKVDEIDRRIAELKSVENWLNMNLGVLRMTIQGLEMQRSGLAAMQGAIGESAQQAEGSAGDAGRRFADAWWKMLQQAQSAPSTGSGQAPSTGSAQAPSTGSGQAEDPEKK
jgi:hypothetical protein